MRIWLFAALILLSLTSHAGELRIGVEPNLKPFVYMDGGGEIAGFDVDVAREVCRRIERDCRFVPMAWDGLIPALRSGKVDLLATGMSITADRAKVVEFSRPYYKTKSRLLVTRPNARGRLGALRGSTDASYAAATLRTFELALYGNQNEMIFDLLAGRLDAAIGPEIELFFAAQSAVEEGWAFFEGEPIDDPDFYGPGIGIAGRQGDELTARVDAELARIMADGTWDRIRSKHLAFDIHP